MYTHTRPQGFKASCAQGRALGFDGKSLIHPKTASGDVM